MIWGGLLFPSQQSSPSHSWASRALLRKLKCLLVHMSLLLALIRCSNYGIHYSGTDDRDLPLGQFTCRCTIYSLRLTSHVDRYCQDLKEEIKWVGSYMYQVGYWCFICPISYTIQRLSEGGQGGHGYDDGEGDDWGFLLAFHNFIALWHLMSTKTRL